MTRIIITEEAFEAIKAMLPVGSVAYEPEVNAEGQREIWLDGSAMSRLTSERRPGETFSDVILRLAALAR
jgi:hypothetical protein